MLAYVVGHLGWYMVKERSTWCGNIGYMALGITYIAVEMWALSEMDERTRRQVGGRASGAAAGRATPGGLLGCRFSAARAPAEGELSSLSA